MAITILGNVGNAGFALPMAQAYPTDVNLQYLLAWNPTLGALDYVPYTGNAFGDFTASRDLIAVRDVIAGEDLSVTQNAVIGGTLDVTGIATFAQKPVFSLGVSALLSDGSITGTSLVANNGAQNGILGPLSLQLNNLQVVSTRVTGWGAPTGTATRTTFATGAVTLPQLAERVKALLDDLVIHGLIGP